MGDRAVITTKENYENDGVGIYVHWNGDASSVAAFLMYARLRRFRTGNGWDYGMARLVQVIANYFGGNLSIGIDRLSRLADSLDNGIYLIDDEFSIVGRIGGFDDEEPDDCCIVEMLRDIDAAQPEADRIYTNGILDEEKIRRITP